MVHLVGFALFLAGAAAMFYGLTASYGMGDVANLSALNIKTNLVIIGAALFVGGCVLIACNPDQRR